MCWLITCDRGAGKARTSTGVGKASLWLVRLALRLVWAALVVAFAVSVWLAPRAYRVSVRVTRAGWRRWQAAHVPPATAPVEPRPARAAIEAHRSDITWTELQLLKEANR